MDTALLNHPLAILAILASVFGFVALALDKAFAFAKKVKRETPMDKMAYLFENLDESLKEVTSSLHLLNEKIDKNVLVIDLKIDRILDEAREIKSKVESR